MGKYDFNCISNKLILYGMANLIDLIEMVVMDCSSTTVSSQSQLDSVAAGPLELMPVSISFLGK